MIIFDLDGTLADCEHRRYLLDPSKYSHLYEYSNYRIIDGKAVIDLDGKSSWRSKATGEPFQHGWKEFFEACSDDEPILPVWFNFNRLAQWTDIQIWSGRCESTREKTVKWLMNKCPLKPTYWNEEGWNHILKMRPIGDYTPDDLLKERWLDEYIDTMWPTLQLPSEETEGTVFYRKERIQFVFDDRPKVVRMWRRRGIFVFDCNQTGKEF